MPSAKEHIDRLVQSMSRLCRILDEELLKNNKNSEFLWKATRHLSYISNKLNLASKHLQEWLLQITSSMSRAFTKLLDSLDLTGDIESRLTQLESSPEMLLEVDRPTWRTLVHQIEFQDQYLNFIQTLLLLHIKVRNKLDVSHFSKHLPRLYDDCRIESKHALVSVNDSDYYSSYSSDSDSPSISISSGPGPAPPPPPPNSISNPRAQAGKPPLIVEAQLKQVSHPTPSLAFLDFTRQRILSKLSPTNMEKADADTLVELRKATLFTRIGWLLKSERHPEAAKKLPPPHQYTIYPYRFLAEAYAPFPPLKVAINLLPRVNLDQTLFSEKNVRDAMTTYDQFTCEPVLISNLKEPDWSKVSLCWKSKTTKSPDQSFWEKFKASRGKEVLHVNNFISAMLGRLNSVEECPVFQWTLHSTKREQNLIRIILKRSPSNIHHPQTTYEYGLRGSQNRSSLTSALQPLKTQGNSQESRPGLAQGISQPPRPLPPSSPPPYRVIGRPRKPSKLRIHREEIKMEDIHYLEEIDERFMETLFEKYILDTGSVDQV